MKNNRYLIPLLTLFALAACDADDPIRESAGGRSPVEVNAGINSRSSLDGKSFTAGDTFILYQDNPAAGNAVCAQYTYSSGAWTGSPGLYWDNLGIWEASGIMKSPASVNFTAVLANGGTLTLAEGGNTFTVAADQRATVDAEFLKNDLLVAYGDADARQSADRKVKLAFEHVMARLTVTIVEEPRTDETPPIIGTQTMLTIDEAKTGNTIVFDASTQTTAVTAAGTSVEVSLRNISSGTNFVYGAILPAQNLSAARLVIGNNVNGKTYYFDLGSVTVADGGELLQQGHHTKLNLKIAKTGVMTGQISITPWAGRSATAEAYPDDYPELEIGEDDDPEQGGGNDPTDDYAGKTIKLTGNIKASQLKLPIGTKAVPFRGTFDGQGYTIEDVELSMDEESLIEDFLGVFGYTDGATIRNLNVKGVKIKNFSNNPNTATGGLAGYVNNTLIENCHVLGYTEGVTSTYDNAGGLVGYVYGVTEIRNCSANTGVMGGHDYTGGFIGRGNEGMVVTQCFSTGTVSAGTGYYVGGFAGYTKEGSITYCYTWSSVATSGARYAGGFIGRAVGTDLTNSYAAGRTLDAGTPKGGLIGYSECAPQRCYWNAALAGGQGSMGSTPGSSNSSFTLLKTEAAMGTVLTGLNRTADNESVSVWKLDRDEEGYVLPVLVDNPGKAEPTEED